MPTSYYLKLSDVSGPASLPEIAPIRDGGLLNGLTTDLFSVPDFFAGLSRASSLGMPSSTTAGKASAQSLGVTLRGGTGIPAVFTRAAAGTVVPRAAVIATSTAGGVTWVSAFWVLGKVVVSSFQMLGGDDEPFYPVQLDYAAIAIGTVATSTATQVVSGWNFVANVAWDGKATV